MAGPLPDDDDAVSSEGIYSIGAVSRMLGVPTQTLRAWEDRYQQVVPTRSHGGQRLFSRDQVDQLTFIVEQIEGGLQPADAHRLLAQRRDDEPVPGAVASRPGPRTGAEAATVLLASHDPYGADFADYFLRTEGYAVHIVFEAAAALDALRGETPSVFVVDLMISGGAGLDLCRSAQALGSVPLLAISAIDTRDQALEAGAEAFLLKPLEPLQLVSTVRDLIGTSAFLRRKARQS